jgi:hypothetical protein
MSKLITASICVSAIPKELIKSHTNGKKYLSVDIWINDEDDNYGNDCSINIQQSKEERESKAKKVYIGNGKTKFGFDGAKQTAPVSNQKPGVVTAPAGDWDDADDDIPF